MRRVACVVLAVSVLVSSCGGAESVSSTTTSTTTPVDFELDWDDGAIATFEAEGMDPVMAAVASLTRVDVIDSSDSDATLRVTFPTADTADLHIAVEPGPGPSLPTIEFSETEDGFEFVYSYSIDLADVPAGTFDDLGALGGDQVVLAAAETLLLTQGGGSASVVVTGVLKKAIDRRVEAFIKTLDARYGTGAALLAAYKVLKAEGDIGKAIAASEEYQAWTARIDEIEDCALHPTSLVTRRRYQEAPEELERIIELIDDTRTEVKVNAFMIYLAQLLSTGSSLIKDVPWLGYIVSPAAAWSKETLIAASEEVIRQLDEAVPDCKGYLAFVSEYSASGEWHPIVGIACQDPADRSHWLVLEGDPAIGVEFETLTAAMDANQGPLHSLRDFLAADLRPSLAYRPGSRVYHSGQYGFSEDLQRMTLDVWLDGEVPPEDRPTGESFEFELERIDVPLPAACDWPSFTG